MANIGTFDSYAGFHAQLINNQTPPDAAFMREFYRLLFAYYQQNGLYDYLNQVLRTTKTTEQPIKPIRNPAWRVVEFYAAKMFPGAMPDALPVETDNEAIIEPLQRFWEWSNFSSVKQRWVRWFAIFGDWFLKVNTKGAPGEVSAIYASIIRPEHVTDMQTDERGFLTYIRMDIPHLDENGETEFYHTEIWDKGRQLVRVWRHDLGLDVAEGRLAGLQLEQTFDESHGEDFIPIVYQPFRDDGGGRGAGAYASQLDKIDEANRQATRLAQTLFRYNKPLWAAISEGTDAAGRPLPAVSFDDLASGGTVTLGDDDILTLPSMSRLEPLVPNINYADALAVLQDHMDELQADLPELAYYSLREMGELTGRAVKFLLDDMISRVQEARGNAESALIRLDQMALTIGNNFNLWNIPGTYQDGAFRHHFLERPILPEDNLETAQIVQMYSSAGATLFAAARAAGLSPTDANDLAEVGLFEELIGGR